MNHFIQGMSAALSDELEKLGFVPELLGAVGAGLLAHKAMPQLQNAAAHAAQGYGARKAVQAVGSHLNTVPGGSVIAAGLDELGAGPHIQGIGSHAAANVARDVTGKLGVPVAALGGGLIGKMLAGGKSQDDQQQYDPSMYSYAAEKTAAGISPMDRLKDDRRSRTSLDQRFNRDGAGLMRMARHTSRGHLFDKGQQVQQHADTAKPDAPKGKHALGGSHFETFLPHTTETAQQFLTDANGPREEGHTIMGLEDFREVNGDDRTPGQKLAFALRNSIPIKGNVASRIGAKPKMPKLAILDTLVRELGGEVGEHLAGGGFTPKALAGSLAGTAVAGALYKHMQKKPKPDGQQQMAGGWGQGFENPDANTMRGGPTNAMVNPSAGQMRGMQMMGKGAGLIAGMLGSQAGGALGHALGQRVAGGVGGALLGHVGEHAGQAIANRLARPRPPTPPPHPTGMAQPPPQPGMP